MKNTQQLPPFPSQTPLSCIDIGVNLSHKRLCKQAPEIIRRAQAVGVERIIVTGTSVASSLAAEQLAKRFPQSLSFTAGVHPHDVKHCDEQTLTRLKKMLDNPSCVAVGECGLDFNRMFSPEATQKEWFHHQLTLAEQTQRPLFLHERDAFEPFYNILKQHRDNISGGVVHCFTGTKKALHAYLDLGMHIGITGWICDPRRGAHLQELVSEIPADRLMLETDSPFLAPKDIEPAIKTNEPLYLPHIVKTVARCRGEDVEETANNALQTTRRFFSL